MAEKRKISLVLADVDGTLVTEQKVLTERAQDAVRALHGAGIRFAITSGRPPRGHGHAVRRAHARHADRGLQRRAFRQAAISRSSTQKTVPAEIARQAIELIRAAWSRCLGLSRQRLADRQGGRAARRPRGVDRQVRAEGRGGLSARTWTSVAKIVGVSDDLDKVQRCEADAQARLRRSVRRPTARSPIISM